MNFLQLHDWVRTFNSERGWDLIPVSMAMVHLLEELGELAEQIQSMGGATITDGGDLHTHELVGEMADSLILLLKLDVICHADLPSAVVQRTGNSDFDQWVGHLPDEPRFTLEDAPFFAVWMLDRLGELSRHVMFLERFKDPSIRKHTRADFSDELALTVVVLIKTAKSLGVDLSSVLEQKVEKISKRFPPREGARETLQYLNHMQTVIDRYLREFSQRFAPDGVTE